MIGVKETICNCGEVIDFSFMRYDFECDCGQKFNAVGQKLDNFYGRGYDYAGEEW
jgi:hypothetical protein